MRGSQVAAILIGVLSLFALQQLFMPKYMAGVYEGSLIEEYYADVKKNKHQVLFVGDCEVYENISPVKLWQDYGITSYIRGSAQQLIWQSYYLLEDALRYEKPEVVVFSVLAMKYNEPQNEAYNRMSIDGMKWSGSKVGSILASMTEEETLISYLFPILRYHDRWREISSDDFTYYFQKEKISHNGFMMRNDIKPVGKIPVGKKLNNYQFGENSYAYLDKITALCKANDIPLVLLKAPSIYPYWYPEWEEQMVDYAKKNDLLYLNTLENMESIGIDLSVDTYDAGLHLNVTGAEKMSEYLGRELVENFKLKDMRSDTATSEAWAKKEKSYDNMREAQLAEIDVKGKVLTFFVKNIE